MIERLVHSLQALAAPAEAQLTRFPDFVARADELALDFADAFRVSDFPDVTLTTDQRDALCRLDAHLDAMSGASRARLWTEEAVRCAPEWAAVRVLASQALEALHVPTQLPPPSTSTYIRGAAT